MQYFFEDFVLDPTRRELHRGGALIAVQPQVFDLLEYLIANRDRVVSKDDILQAVWGGRIVSESALTTRINAMRTAVGDNGDQQRLIRTLPRKGIRFVGVVRERARPLDEAAAAHAVVGTETPERTAAYCDEPVPAERRQLTIASCELLLGAEATTVDPEDLSEIIQDYHGCVADIIRRHNELVAHAHGNTAVVYFGYPQAHEDDPERAVRAALELVAAATALNTRTPLQMRVGIATGLVVVGDTIDSGGSQQRDIIGETPNLAARLQAIAEPNTVVISESTRKLLGNLFELEDLGAKELKGISGPVRTWAALRPASIESRFEAFHASGLADLVGRGEELELLLRRWSRAKAGGGQVVLLSGEAGIGKSRLTVALLEAIASGPHTRLRNFCSPQHTDSPLYPTIGQIERAAGFTRDDTSQAKLDKLDTLLAQSSTSAHDAALFAEMLSLPNDGRYPTLELTPQQRRQRTLEALVLQVTTLSRQNPVLMIFEDMQWADPTSLELFGRIVDKIPTLRVLLLVTFRPEFESPWIGRPYVTALTVNRLAEREVGAMIDGLVGNKLLPANVRQDIFERTDGIPLFVEEMTKAVLEAESEGEARRTAAAVPSPAPAVPASLHASLMARLDRLGPAKEVAQIGAAIGREFPHPLLAAVVRKPEPELNSALDRLIAAGLLFRQGMAPHASYLFKHALVQDAAYGTLLREPRVARPYCSNPRKPILRNNRDPTGTAGASMHRCRADREGGGAVGQSRTAIIGALRGDRSGRTVHPRPRPSCVVAGNAGAAPRTDQASGGACERPVSCKRDGGDRDKSGVRPSPRDDRASGKDGGARRGPAPSILRPLRLLHSEVHQLRRRGSMRACAAVPCIGTAAEGNGPPYDRTSSARHYLAVRGQRCRRALSSRPRFGIL